MVTMKERVVELLRKNDGLSDREITDILIKKGAPQQPINQICHGLEKMNIIVRAKKGERIKNYLIKDTLEFADIDLLEQRIKRTDDSQTILSEDDIKRFLGDWLVQNGWNVQTAWGHSRGIDILATKEDGQWIIEVKGQGSRPQMRVNYFISILGETLQRMNNPKAEYSIALPDIKQFRLLWDRLPILAKQRTGISAFFVDKSGKVYYSR